MYGLRFFCNDLVQILQKLHQSQSDDQQVVLIEEFGSGPEIWQMNFTTCCLWIVISEGHYDSQHIVN